MSLKNYIAKYDPLTTPGEWLSDIQSVSGTKANYKNRKINNNNNIQQVVFSELI